MVWTEIPLDGHTDLCVFPRGGIMSARHSTVEPLLYDHPQNHIGVVV